MINDSDKGYIRCDDGHLHLGSHGAAGTLLRHFPKSETEPFYYLIRCRASQGHPSCFSIPGGAVEGEETLWEGAMRWWNQDVFSVYPFTYNDVIHHNDHGNWSYTTFLADCADARHIRVKNRYEHTYGIWYTKEGIDRLLTENMLHPGFAKTWNLCGHLL